MELPEVRVWSHSTLLLPLNLETDSMWMDTNTTLLEVGYVLDLQ